MTRRKSEFPVRKPVDASTAGRTFLSMQTLPSTSEMYQALLRRDPGYEGVFLVGVRTTGVFCRPTCSARKPRRGNTEFFGASTDALHAGYRPCKRCRPMDPASPPGWVRTLLDRVDRQPARRLRGSDLKAMRIDPARARRYFTRHYGMTFNAYHRARRMGLALAEIRRGADVTTAALRNGYHSTSGFRDAFARILGAPPGRAARAPRPAALLARWLETPLGPMLAIAGDDGLRVLEFVDRRGLERELEAMRQRLGCAITPGRSAILDQVAEELAQYFTGTRRAFSIPLAPAGSPFQKRAWERLRRIPYGETISYARQASDIGRTGAQRAVGRANGQNPIAIVVPCHRVVRSDGSLCGYGGGLWRKRWLLEHERSRIACRLADPPWTVARPPAPPIARSARAEGRIHTESTCAVRSTRITSLDTQTLRARSCPPAAPPRRAGAAADTGNTSRRPARGRAPS
jgi:AraC family transcriptional regulator of adaptative response/methylated-DNA-[protein]-cysteine methyltransferase